MAVDIDWPVDPGRGDALSAQVVCGQHALRVVESPLRADGYLSTSKRLIPIIFELRPFAVAGAGSDICDRN